MLSTVQARPLAHQARAFIAATSLYAGAAFAEPEAASILAEADAEGRSPATLSTGPTPPPPAPPRPPKPDKPASAVVESRGYGTRAESEPPRYVRHGNETGVDAFKDLDWLLLGADYRARYEVRHNDYRRGTLSDDPLLLRTRLYLGIDKIADPLRFGVELQDSRMVHSEAPDSTRDVNKLDVLQSYVELYGKDLLGAGEPLRLQAGRLAFEYLDRRLISRNPWRNTTNNFEGFRLVAGSHKSDFWVDLLAVQPVLIDTDGADQDEKGRWLYGALGSYAGWSDVVTLQPYYLLLDESPTATRQNREIHTTGLRGYAVFKSGFDYDFDLALQNGHSGSQDHQAQAATFELGYTFARPWSPRASGFIGYASGDKDPTDSRNNRFNRLFGFGRPWSANDYHIWENIVTPKARIELKPGSTVQIEGGYSAFWLASDRDSWSGAGRRDASGHSGDFIGHEIDGRVRWRAHPLAEVIAGYAHFFAGDFTANTGPSPDSDFVYLELTLQLFK